MIELYRSGCTFLTLANIIVDNIDLNRLTTTAFTLVMINQSLFDFVLPLFYILKFIW